MGENKDLDPDRFHVPAVQIGSAQGPVPKPGEPLEPESEPKPDPREELERTLHPKSAVKHEIKSEQKSEQKPEPYLPMRSKADDEDKNRKPNPSHKK